MLIVSLILLQIFVFIALIYVFRKVMTRNVVSVTKHIEELSHEHENKEKDITRRLEEARQKAQEVIAQAREEAQKLKDKVVKESEDEREKTLSQARSQSDTIIQQADKSRELLLSELEQKIEKEAINKACELIQHVLPEQFKKDVHLHWMEDLIEGSFGQLEQMRIPEGIKEATIVSAFPLNEQQRGNLVKKLSKFLGRDVTLKEETDPKIVAGVVFSFGNLVIDGSLRNKIQKQAKNINV